MASSFRRRLFAIAALTALACGAAIAGLLFIARVTRDTRIEHARDNVTREAERLRAVLEDLPSAERAGHALKSEELRSAYLDTPAPPSEAPPVVEALARAASTGRLVVLDQTDDGTPVLTAATPVSGGGYVFATQRVVAGRETRSLRLVVVLLALLTAALIVASLRTLSAVERDVSSLRASLAALSRDLTAPVARPALRELGEVAVGVETLARNLDRSQAERAGLARDLAAGERLAALGRVAAGIAHEVRNPLASMKLRADLARTGGEVTPSIARDLEDIASEIARLDRLVSDLLVVAGRKAGPQTDVDVGELVGRRVALIAPWASERGVAVVSDGSARAQVDADAIARAVDNLLRNAVEASAKGGHVNAEVRAGSPVTITVIDRGPGVPPERAAELFEPFFTTKSEGTGLGLALARAVAGAHKGTLTYAREDGCTRLTLALPPG
jgi:signal transduction histidine kinase